MASHDVEYQRYVDYVQSANTLFHFMRQLKYLKTILTKRAIVPRYCIENVDYLNIQSGNSSFSNIAVLQKCFCDIPMHKLADTFSVTGTGANFDMLEADEKLQVEHNNTHFDLYGGFAIGFSKAWSERKKLQPIHYLNTSSSYSNHFQSLLSNALTADDIPDEFSDDVLYRLAFIKPLRGVMQRSFQRKSGETVSVDIYKNFHDECEWRFVPDHTTIVPGIPGNVVADERIVKSDTLVKYLNQQLEEDTSSGLWLRFDFDDIRYLIVPETTDRIELINTIMEIPDEMFLSSENINLQKHILISKIFVLSEIRKDW